VACLLEINSQLNKLNMNSKSEINESFINKITDITKNNFSGIIGVIAGGVGGFLYYNSVGCSSGSCSITANPWVSIIWGAFFGYFASGLFKSKRKNNIIIK
jgi:hypothetical protein